MMKILPGLGKGLVPLVFVLGLGTCRVGFESSEDSFCGDGQISRGFSLCS